MSGTPNTFSAKISILGPNKKYSKIIIGWEIWIYMYKVVESYTIVYFTF